MAARLVPQKEGTSIISLEKAITLIGRHPDCDGVLSDNQKISRRHCCIAQVENRLILRDLGSMNGVSVNGEQVSEVELREGDEITIGDETFVLEVRSRGPGDRGPSPAKANKKLQADEEAPTPQRPGHKPKPAPVAQPVPPPVTRRPKVVDISQEFPVAIPEDDEDSSEVSLVDDPPRSRNGRPPLPGKPKYRDVDDLGPDDILKLDSGEIRFSNFDDPSDSD